MYDFSKMTNRFNTNSYKWDVKEKELPKWLENLEKHIPMTIMAVLIVYCLKDLKTQLTTLFIPYLLACLTVVFTYKWKKNTFLSIILSTLVYMIFIRL